MHFYPWPVSGHPYPRTALLKLILLPKQASEAEAYVSKLLMSLAELREVVVYVLEQFVVCRHGCLLLALEG